MKRDIIYVDDEPDNIVVFEAAFEDEFNVWTAGSGPETLELLERVPAPVVVADQRMPGMTGVELFETIRQRYPHTKRILLTGYTDQEAILDAINKGHVFQFVKKPWERHLLFSVLIQALEAHDLAVANTSLTDRLVVSERCALLGQATARMTHEMGNQLCVLPLLELIEEKYRDHEDLVKVARFARQTHDHLVGLLDEVKSFMQFEHEQFSRQPMSLAGAVQELVAFLRFDESVPHDRFTLRVHAEPVVLANKAKVQQVIVNLIKNAAYAIRGKPEGEITVTVERESDEARLSVADNGCGMMPQTLERIWEPFFTTKGKEGTGLGLDVSRQLIESHGGCISCESTLNVGTTFLVRLPTIEQGQSPPVDRLEVPAPSGLELAHAVE